MIEVVVPGKGIYEFPDGMSQDQMRDALLRNFAPKEAPTEDIDPLGVDLRDFREDKTPIVPDREEPPRQPWSIFDPPQPPSDDMPPFGSPGDGTLDLGPSAYKAVAARIGKGLTDLPFIDKITFPKGDRRVSLPQVLDEIYAEAIADVKPENLHDVEFMGKASEMAGFLVPLTGAAKAGYGVAKTIPKARPFFQKLAGAAITGGLIEADDPDAALKSAALFATLQAGTGSIAALWNKLHAPGKKIIVQELGEQIAGMQREGLTEGQIIRRMKQSGDLRAFEERLAREVEAAQKQKSAPPAAPPTEPIATPQQKPTAIPPLESSPAVAGKPRPVRPSGPIDLGKAPGVVAAEAPDIQRVRMAMDSPEGFAAFQRELEQEREAALAANLAALDSGDTLRFSSPKRKSAKILHKSARNPGKWQVTDIDEAGPSGHADFDSKEDAIRSISGERVGNQLPTGDTSYRPDVWKSQKPSGGYVTDTNPLDLDNLPHESALNYVEQTTVKRAGGTDEVIGYTQSNAPEWFRSNPEGFTVEQATVALQKARDGKKLGVAQERFVRRAIDITRREAEATPQRLDATALDVGDTVHIRGEKHTVTRHDGADLVLEDHDTHRVSSFGGEIEIDRGSHQKRGHKQTTDEMLRSIQEEESKAKYGGVQQSVFGGEDLQAGAAQRGVEDSPLFGGGVESSPHDATKRARAAQEAQGSMFGDADYRPEEADIAREQFYQQERGGESTVDRGGHTETVRALDMPEIVELAHELLGGKYPRIKAKLKGKGLYGYYRGPGKEIGINPDTAKNEDIAWVLAHEIGHLVDDLPDYLLKKRGNILGRVATLKKYMKHYLAGEPGGPGPLTDAEKEALKAQAEELLRVVTEEGVDEVIRRTLPIKPEDVLAIWNGAAPRDTDLYKYLARLESAEKKSIVVAALKGQLPEDIQRFAKVVEEPTGRTTTTRTVQEPTAAQVKAKLRDLIAEEIKRRNLLARDVIMEELRTLTRDLKPMDEASLTPKMKKYRYSGREMYANAISALVNNPQYLKDTAPQFWRGFHAYMEEKPEVKRAYDEIQQRLTDPEAVSTARRQRRHAGYEAGERAYAERAQREKPSIKQELLRQFIDTHAPVIRDVKAARKAGKNVSPQKNPVYALEEFVYRNAQVREYLTAMGSIDKARQAEGIEKADFSDLLFLRRVATERAEVANPWGYDAKTAGEELERLRERLGPEKYAKAEALVESFQQARKERVVDFVEQARVWTPELVDFAQNNPNWARFDVVNYIAKNYGGLGQSSAKVYRKVGTFADIADPFTASVLNDMAIIHATNAKIAAKSVVDFYREHYPESVVEAKPFAQRPKGNDWELIEYPHDGKKVGHYLPRDVAESIFDDPYRAQVVGKILLTPLFRELFVGINPGFMAFNAMRDFQRTLINLPQGKVDRWVPYSGVPRLAYWWLKSLPESVKDAYGIPSDIVEEMYRKKMLISVSSSGYALDGEEREFERQMARFSLGSHLQRKGFRQRVVSVLHDLNSAIEKNTKVASYQYLKANQDRLGFSDEEIGHMVRGQLGSPDFLRKGKSYHFYNNFFLFSNAIKEGWRGDWDVAKTRPGEYAWKRAQYSVLPKLLMVLGASGGMGAGVKAIYDKVSEYDKSNYFVIPLGLTPEGKAVVLRVPMDETGRVFGGITWKTYSREGMRAMEDLAAFGSGQVPGVSPLPGILKDIADYASGRVPHDDFRNQPAINQDVYDAREASPEAALRSAREFGKYLWNQSGGGIVHRFKTNRVEGVQRELEQLLGMPVASNILGRFVKVTDQGEREEYREAARQEAAKEADKRIKKRNAIVDALNEKGAPDAITLFADLVVDGVIDVGPGKDTKRKYSQFLRQYRRYEAGAESAATQSVAMGATTGQKVAIILKAKEKMTTQEYNGWVLHLLGKQLISRDVLVQAAMTETGGR